MTTDGAFFQFPQGCVGQVRRFTFMHIKATSSGVVGKYPVPFYLMEWLCNVEAAHNFMGNVTVAGKALMSKDDVCKGWTWGCAIR